MISSAGALAALFVQFDGVFSLGFQRKRLPDPGAPPRPERSSTPRNGNDLGDRFPLAAAAIEELPVRSCVIDGEAIVCDDKGLAVFDLIRGHGTNARAVLCAFDLLEVNGEDIRPSRSRIANGGWPDCCGCRTTALHSTRNSKATAR